MLEELVADVYILFRRFNIFPQEDRIRVFHNLLHADFSTRNIVNAMVIGNVHESAITTNTQLNIP